MIAREFTRALCTDSPDSLEENHAQAFDRFIILERLVAETAPPHVLLLRGAEVLFRILCGRTEKASVAGQMLEARVAFTALTDVPWRRGSSIDHF